MLHVFDAGGELGGGRARRPVLGQRLACCLAAAVFATTWTGVCSAQAAEAVAQPEQATRVLHLDEAIAAGLEHQPSVLTAKAQTEAASGRVEQARSGYLPQVTGNALAERVHGSASVRTTPNAPPTTVGAGGQTYNVFSFGVSASQLIWDFGQ